jgi:hypothetical protein
MSEIASSFIVYGYYLLVGVVFSLPALMPSVRAQARGSRGWRIAIITLLALIAFSLAFVVWSQSETSVELSIMVGEAIQVGDTPQNGATEIMQQVEANRGALQTELWLRSVVPDPLQPACFNGGAELCALADLLQNPFRPHGAGFAPNALRSLLSLASCTLLGWLFTRRKAVGK